MIRWMMGLGMVVLLVSAAHGQESSASSKPLRSTYYTCIKASRGVTLAVNNCIGTEHDFQDKRLNTVYQRLRGSMSADQRTTIRDEKRAWIAQRDKACGPDGSGGTASMLDSNQCQLDQTAARGRTRNAHGPLRTSRHRRETQEPTGEAAMTDELEQANRTAEQWHLGQTFLGSRQVGLRFAQNVPQKLSRPYRRVNQWSSIDDSIDHNSYTSTSVLVN